LDLEVGMEAIEMSLRERVIYALDVEKQTRVAVAARFAVSHAWIGKLLRRRRDTGSIAPRPHGGGPPPKLADASQLKALVEQQRDATLKELGESLAQQHNVALHPSTVARRLKKLGITLKKRSSTPVNATASG
jgi:transposase